MPNIDVYQRYKFRTKVHKSFIINYPGLSACRRSFSGGARPGLINNQKNRALAQNLPLLFIKDIHLKKRYLK